MLILYSPKWSCNFFLLLSHPECPLNLMFFGLVYFFIFLFSIFNYGASSSLKGFHELELGMNLWLRFSFFASLAFQLFDWLHDDYIGNQNRFDLISRIWDLSISFHTTWFTFEFLKAQTLMSILYHLTLVVY